MRRVAVMRGSGGEAPSWDPPRNASFYPSRRRPSAHEPAPGEVREDLLRRLLDALLAGVDRDLGRLGRLVGVADPGEVLDQARPRFLVETFRVARLEDVERRLDVDLDER